MPELRQSTSQVIRFGPFVDSTDGVTPETGLTIAQADMQLSKDGSAFAQKNAVGNATHDVDGWYTTTLDATDTNTTAELILQVNVAGALPVWVSYDVVTQSFYDAKYTGTFNNLGGVAQTADHTTAIADIPTVAEFNARTLPSASYFDFTTNQVIVATNNDKAGYSISGTKTTLDALNDIAATQIVSSGAITTSGGAVSNVTTVATCTTNTDMRGTDNALLASSAPTNFSDLAISVTTGQVTVGTNNDKTGYSISGTKTTLDALNDITSASVWAEATRTLTSGANIALAKGVGVTGFNDIAATDIVSGGAITTSGGIANADTKKVNGATVLGNGTGANLWRGS